MFAKLRSFFITSIQRVVGRPLLLCTGVLTSLYAFLAGVLLSNLIIWPNHFNLLFCMTLLHGFALVLVYSSSFDIFLGQNIPIANLSCLL